MIIDILISAVRIGELDAQLAQGEEAYGCAQVSRSGVILAGDFVSVMTRPALTRCDKNHRDAIAKMFPKSLPTMRC
jgi:hypothetical protein